MIRIIYILLMTGLLILTAAPQAWTKSASQNSRLKIADIARDIEDQQITLDGPSDFADLTQQTAPSQETLKDMRIWLMDAMNARGIEALGREVLIYSKTAESLSSDIDVELSQLFEAYAIVRDSSAKPFDKDKARDAIESGKDSRHWFVKSRAWYLDSLSNTYDMNYNLALGSANKALTLIPDNTDPLTAEASFEVNGLISAIWFFLADIDMAAQSTQDYLAQAKRTNRKIDGLAILNNFSYVLNTWNEHETALITSATSYRMSSGLSPDKRVKAAYRYAQTLNAMGDYAQAETILQSVKGIEGTDIWKMNLLAETIVAKAGQGRITEARKDKITLKEKLASRPKYAKRFESRLGEANALIALAQNDARAVFNIMQSNARTSNSQILAQTSKETQKLMGTLANDKEVQRAREAELTTRNNLQRARIEAQERQGRMMRLIIFLLTAIGIGAIIVALRQRAYAKREEVLGKRARAGEKAKRDFLAVMSHELRTPLNGIIGLAEILSRDGPNEDVKFKNGIIYKSGLNLLELLTNVLDMSKMDGGHTDIDRMPTALREITNNLNALWKIEAEKKNIAFTFYVADDVPQLLDIDPMRTRQCLENLISNAIKFTPTGRVHTHITYEPSPVVGQDGILKIIVADTGEGMTAEKAAEIFEPFTQADVSIRRKFGGSGLGLAITRSIARLMDGDASVISAPGRGSEFTLVLRAPDLSKTDAAHADDAGIVALRPTIKEKFLQADAKFNAASQPQPGADTKPEAEKITSPGNKADVHEKLSGLRVLIAEDLQSNREILKIFLKPAGVSVTTAENGAQAIECLSRGTYDIVLMDVHMPVMDGVEAMKAIRGGSGPNAQVPIITLTADASPESNARCMAAGADVFLTKPVVSAELFSAMAILQARTLRRNEAGFKPDASAVA